MVLSLSLHLLVDDARNRLLEQKQLEALQLGELVVAVVRKGMEAGAPESVRDYLDAIVKHEGVHNIRIFGADGTLRYALDRTLVGRQFQRSSHWECKTCHDGPELPRRSVVRDLAGHKVFSLDVPLRGEESCKECHHHERLLGNLLLDIHLTEPDLASLASDRRLAWTGVLLTALTLIGVWLLVKSMVVRPIRGLVAAAREVEAGDFEPTFPGPRGDEIGELVSAFQRMTQRLGRLVHHQEEEIAARTEELRRSQQQALHHEKMVALGRLTGGVAHEIGNPLASISAMVQMLMRQNIDPATKQTAREILDQVQRINRIVRELLEHFHPGMRETEWVDVSRPVAAALRIARYDRGLKRVQVQTRVDPDCAAVHVVEDELLQVLLNVFLNAADAMPEGGELHVEARPAAAGRVEIRVADTGCGIAAEELEKVFDPFFTTKPPGKGTGLGLWVSYSIVSRWGGSIALESEPGRGTVVQIIIPEGKEVAADAGEDPRHRRRAGAVS